MTLGSQRLSKKTSALCIDCLFTLLKDLQIHAFENLAIFRGPCAVVGDSGEKTESLLDWMEHSRTGILETVLRHENAEKGNINKQVRK